MATVALGLSCTMVAAQSTYTFTGAVFNQARTGLDYNTDSLGTANNRVYPGGSRITGSFTTAAPLSANLNNALITVTSYSFNDGSAGQAYASTDPEIFVAVPFRATTDANGDLVSARFEVARWQTAGPHSVTATNQNSRFDIIRVQPGDSSAKSDRNCLVLNGGLTACTSSDDDFENESHVTSGGSWLSPAPNPVPTLSEWAMILFGLALAAGAAITVQRRRFAV